MTTKAIFVLVAFVAACGEPTTATTAALVAGADEGVEAQAPIGSMRAPADDGRRPLRAYFRV